MISFNNTKIAFAAKSNKELQYAYFVFKFISINWLNKLGTSFLQLGFNIGLPLKPLVRWTVFKHFCGGETIEECDNTIQSLSNYNVKTILDYSVEGKQVDEDFDACLGKAIASIERATKDKNVPFCVIKLTGLIPFNLLKKASSDQSLNEEEKIAFSKGRYRVDLIAQNAYNSEIPLMIDAEESWIQDAIDEIALQMMKKYNQERAIVYNTLQMYRHDRLNYLKELFKISLDEGFYLGVKIVRGAYMEKERARAALKNYPSPIQKDKNSTDNDFNESMEFCVKNVNRIALCCGTHNEESSLLLTELLRKHEISNNQQSVYFSQLLGMSDHISFNLAKAGYNVAKYVPYGPIKDVMPYLIRRADENTSIAGQTGRELSLIIQEMKRRRRAK